MVNLNFQLVALDPDNIGAAFELLELIERGEGIDFRNPLFWRRRNAISRCLGCLLFSNKRAAGLILFPNYDPTNQFGIFHFDIAELIKCPPGIGLQCLAQSLAIIMAALTASRNGALDGLMTRCASDHPAYQVVNGFGSRADTDDVDLVAIDHHGIVAAAQELSKYLGGVATQTSGAQGGAYVHMQHAGFISGIGFLAITSALAQGNLGPIGHNVQLLPPRTLLRREPDCAA